MAFNNPGGGPAHTRQYQHMPRPKGTPRPLGSRMRDTPTAERLEKRKKERKGRRVGRRGGGGGRARATPKENQQDQKKAPNPNPNPKHQNTTQKKKTQNAPPPHRYLGTTIDILPLLSLSTLTPPPRLGSLTLSTSSSYSTSSPVLNLSALTNSPPVLKLLCRLCRLRSRRASCFSSCRISDLSSASSTATAVADDTRLWRWPWPW